MKIRSQISLTILLTNIFLMFAIGFFIYKMSDSDLREQINLNLESVIRSRAKNIEIYFENQEKLVKSLVESDIYNALLMSEKNDVEYDSKLNFVNSNIRKTLEKNANINQIDILDNKGIVLSSTNIGEVGSFRGRSDSFINAKVETFFSDIYFLEKTDIPVISISSPVYNNEEFKGVIAIKLVLDDLYEIMENRDDLGDTGETILVNRNNYVISPSRFKSDAVLKQKINTLSTQQCFNDDLTDSTMKDITTVNINQVEEMYSDYRGDILLGNYVYVPKMDWCLLAEYSKSEVFASQNELLQVLLIIFFVSILILAIVILLTSYHISKPIEALRQGIGFIEKGDLNYQVSTNRKDEIGQLAMAFDRMAEAIAQSRMDVDNKVKKQTNEIANKSKELEEQQVATLNILQDVEEEKVKVIQEKDKVDTILYGIADGVFVVDNDLKITKFNKAASEITGYFPSEALGKKYNEILKFKFDKTGKAGNDFIKRALLASVLKERTGHTTLISREGKEIPITESAAPLMTKKGETIGFVIAFRDVTKEREIDKAKTEFVSLASHQLRTPLSSINWYTEMLLAGDAGKLNEEQINFIEEIAYGNQRMVELVNSLLNVSRLELGTFMVEPEMLDLRKIADEAINELKGKILEKKLKFTKKYDDLQDMMLDKGLTHIIFQNYLSNAVKYTPDGGEIKLSILKNDKNIEISVKDSGMGITESQHDKIFSKLFRADNVKESDTEGTGLGLYMVKAIVEQVGGRVWFESKINKGSTFYATLPIDGMKKKEGTRKLNT